jgi:HlyD family secretion protein
MTPMAGGHERSIRRYLIFGIGTACLLVLGIGGLASVTEVSGAIISAGALVVDSRVKKIQHPVGGIIGQIRVREGDHVKAGDILERLDDTATRTNLAIVAKSLDQLEVRQARLLAERDGTSTVIFPSSIMARRSESAVAQIIASERLLFAHRRGAREGQKSQLHERLTQLGDEVDGLIEQRSAKHREIELIEKELTGIRKLWDSRLIAMERLIALERDVARLKGETGQLTASIAQAKGRASENRLQIHQIDQELRSSAGAELREVEDKIAELVERKIAAEDQLMRIEIRSPQDGVIHQLAVHTIGGVVSAGESLMYIVPVAEPLSIEARVMPQDIDQLSPSQPVTVRLSAFNQRTTPELSGILANLSADLTIDQRTGEAFYTARVILSPGEAGKLDELTLTAGMPAEVFFPTKERTILSYLIKPLLDQLQRVFREE